MGQLSNLQRTIFLRAIAEAERVGQQGNLGEAHARLIRVRDDTARLGVRSAEVDWHLAKVCDYLSDGLAALDHVLAALEQDPLAAHINDSFNIIVSKLQRAVATAPPEEVSAEAYDRLRRIGAADDACHLAMARHLIAIDRAGEATVLLESVTRLYPACREAWVELGAAARRAGRPDLAARAERELILLQVPSTVVRGQA